MDYKIVMPVLSDTMQKGKLIRWRVHEGDRVHKGDVIAEVESDKAIMEVQTFQDGIVKKLLVKEGEEVPIQTPIAIIETDTNKKEALKPQQPQTSISPKEEPSTVPPVIQELLTTSPHPLPQGEASAAAKKRAAELGIDIQKLHSQKQLPTPAHLHDIEEIALKRYFTPKALKLLQDYNIDPKTFRKNHKITDQEVMSYIKEHNIPYSVPLSANRKAVIQTVEYAAKKPIYFVFETFVLKKVPNYKITAILLKKLGDVMQKHPLTRAKLEQEYLKIYPHSNISVAVAKGEELYMVVCKNIEEKSLEEINIWLQEIKDKTYIPQDLLGSTFGISNLGMFGIERFSAMINKDDVGIAAFGALQDNTIAVTFTFDHRILNGLDAAKFIQDCKKAFQGEENV